MQPPKPYREERPWGDFIEFTHNEPTTVKIITVKAGEILSLQTHTMRDEFWCILGGSGHVTKGKDVIPAKKGETHWIPRGTEHRIAGGTEALEILEISFGNFDEKDIVRLDDKYGRIQG
ncbi:MAG: phosphomannose isomerase type II C-terminal cupin domain [Candidatus Paceibacterota bacterium]|jgi:mannose-6-phosphate isomerase-like protein (cupin superfamily)